MAVVLFLLALAMIGTGGAAVLFGAPIVQVERGYTMVIAGTVGASAGMMLLGVALAVARLGRIAHELVQVRDRLDRQVSTEGAPELHPGPPPLPPAPAEPPAPVPVPDRGTVRAQPSPDQRRVVGQYSSGGNAYVMFDDGSIEADTPSGKHRFASLEELRAFVAGGGERA